MDDYIKREQALKLIESGGTWGWSKNALYDEMKNLPAADVAPVVHGKWELRHEGYGHYWECSVCHTNPCIYVTRNTKFCPNCGAKMDLEEDK